MSLFIASLNSGSNGNCYYIGNDKEAVLIDAGISCAETERRMKRLNLSMSMVRAVFVSHEHTDHITGIPTLSKKYKLPVYITERTLQNSRLKIEKHLIHPFEKEIPVNIGALSVTAFKKSHDAGDPHSFLVSGNDVNIGIFTDIGFPGKDLIKYFKICHAVFLEANYCEYMLENGSYPKVLKKRISGRKGHLSNTQALELFRKHKPYYLSHLILSHLSENNNDPRLVNDLFKPYAEDINIIIASRFAETDLYEIIPRAGMKGLKFKAVTRQNHKQLSLF
ncbi:MAG: MBL fold metallo-hydrolase [Bacteroidetes bacterium]|nr:MBL fold metallo-hydrolase [Bacteroidota bacterium]MBS1930546.1 MBL fold metallo-hydrolase [Bacteroidota bacterium]